jgi:ubiquinone/menaquinone biosynthesis C-methylase UbiE
MPYNSIPKTESDLLLYEWGYDLMEEYFQLIKAADFPKNDFILDIATGTGRAASTLSRLGYNVITGDYNINLKSESEIRITGEYLNKVSYARLNLERIPFINNSVNNIVFLNTLHELENPTLCLEEILRIHSGKGKLLIADFNSEGFDVLDKSYLIRFNKLHTRGKIIFEEVKTFLSKYYHQITEVNTKLNYGFIANRKVND